MNTLTFNKSFISPLLIVVAITNLPPAISSQTYLFLRFHQTSSLSILSSDSIKGAFFVIQLVNILVGLKLLAFTNKKLSDSNKHLYWIQPCIKLDTLEKKQKKSLQLKQLEQLEQLEQLKLLKLKIANHIETIDGGQHSKMGYSVGNLGYIDNLFICQVSLN